MVHSLTTADDVGPAVASNPQSALFTSPSFHLYCPRIFSSPLIACISENLDWIVFQPTRPPQWEEATGPLSCHTM
jgi:hypothetical protein